MLINWSLWAVAPLVLAGATLIVHARIFAGIHIAFAALIAITIVHEAVAVSDHRRVLTNLREAQAQLRQALEQIEALGGQFAHLPSAQGVTLLFKLPT